MDAQSTNIETGRVTHLQTGSDPEMDNLRSDVLKAEDRIVEDADKLQEMFTPERVANQLVSAAREELLIRTRSVDLKKLKDLGDKVIAVMKDHPYLSALLGLGVLGGIAYGVLRNTDTGMIERITEKSQRFIGAPSEFGERYKFGYGEYRDYM